MLTHVWARCVLMPELFRKLLCDMQRLSSHYSSCNKTYKPQKSETLNTAYNGVAFRFSVIHIALPIFFTGFGLGSTVQSKTKGIWIWCRQHPSKPNTCLILLDTEGLGDPEKVIFFSVILYHIFSALCNIDPWLLSHLKLTKSIPLSEGITVTMA